MFPAPRRRPSLFAGMLIWIAEAEQSTRSWGDASKLNETGKDEHGDPTPPLSPLQPHYKINPGPNILLHLGLLKWLLGGEHRKKNKKKQNCRLENFSTILKLEPVTQSDTALLMALFASSFLSAIFSIEKKKKKINGLHLEQTFFFFLFTSTQKQNKTQKPHFSFSFSYLILNQLH